MFKNKVSTYFNVHQKLTDALELQGQSELCVDCAQGDVAISVFIESEMCQEDERSHYVRLSMSRRQWAALCAMVEASIAEDDE